MKIDFQVMMIWLIAAILILVRKEERKLITASPPTNENPADYLCVSTGSKSTFKHTNMKFDPANGKIIKNCADV